MRCSLLFLLFFSFVLRNDCFAQDQYFVKDSRTKTSIPFVKIYPSEGVPFLTDLDGMFLVKDTMTSLRLKYSGYRDSTLMLDQTESIIFLEREIQEIDEVLVLPGVNPAHRIIKMAQNNRIKNHPLKNDAFSYKSYSKFIFDVNQARLIPDGGVDSTSMKLQDYFKNQHLFVMENASKRTFYPPGKDKEEILAYKVSGISDPMLSTFAQDMQSFNFYDNEFNIFGEDFINPLAKDGIRRYLFILEDTLINKRDTTFTIFFRPRKGKNFKGLKGHLYINTNGFAVEKVNATAWRPNGEGRFDVTILQEYAFVDHKKWFPIKLSTELKYGNSITGKDTVPAVISGYGHTYIDSIILDPIEKRDRFYDNYDLTTSTDAGDVSMEEWQKLRTYDLTEKELRTHMKADSISKANQVVKRLAFIKELAKGKIQLGKLSLPLRRLLGYNQYEKFRLGFGLETSPQISRRIILGGYFAYGTNDKEWKYGLYSNVTISQKRNTQFGLNFQQDLIERGGQVFTSSIFDLYDTERLRELYVQQKDRQRLVEISFSSDIKANMNVRLFTNYQRIGFTNGYEFSPSDTTLMSSAIEIEVAELGVELKWNIGEKYMLLGESKVSQGLKYPSIKFKAIKGFKGVWESDFDYWRFNLLISQKIKVRDYFSINLSLTAMKTIGDVPISLMHNGRGTRINWNINTANTFQTMVSGTYYSRDQIALFSSVKLKAFHTKAKWNEPQLTLYHAIGYGGAVNTTNHNIDFRTMDKGYLEAGLTLDNFYTFKNLPLGIGVFYNYGPTRDQNWKNNIVPKVSISFAL